MIRMSRLFAAVPVVAVVALAPDAARADFYRHGYGYGPYRGYYGGPRAFGPSYYGHGYGPRQFGTGGLVAGTLLGLGVGAAIATTVPRPYVPPPVVYAPPPPVVYAPPPVVYAPRPYYPAPAYYGPGYGYYR